MSKYETIREMVRSCQACPLSFRGAGVPGEFVPYEWIGLPPPVMVILEAPGGVEQEVGRPIWGDSGQLFRTIMKECGVENYYVTNVAKHRPLVVKGKQQKPDSVAIKACSGFLEAELTMVRPSKLILCGSTANTLVFRGNPSMASVINRTIMSGLPTPTTIEARQLMREFVSSLGNLSLEQGDSPLPNTKLPFWEGASDQARQFQAKLGLKFLNLEEWLNHLQHHRYVFLIGDFPDENPAVALNRMYPAPPTTNPLDNFKGFKAGIGYAYVRPSGPECAAFIVLSRDGTFTVYHSGHPSDCGCKIPHELLTSFRIVPTTPLYHPAYFLHNRTASFVNKGLNDFKRALRNFMGADIPHYEIEEITCPVHL